MRGLIYDLITGMAIIASLYIITDVMRANQNFIASSAEAETKVEQLYVESDETLIASEASTYTISDVYALFRTFVTTDDKLMQGIELKLSFKQVGAGWGSLDWSINDATPPNYILETDKILKARVNLATNNETLAKLEYTVTKTKSGERIRYSIVQKS